MRSAVSFGDLMIPSHSIRSISSSICLAVPLAWIASRVARWKTPGSSTGKCVWFTRCPRSDSDEFASRLLRSSTQYSSEKSGLNSPSKAQPGQPSEAEAVRVRLCRVASCISFFSSSAWAASRLSFSSLLRCFSASIIRLSNDASSCSRSLPQSQPSSFLFVVSSSSSFRVAHPPRKARDHLGLGWRRGGSRKERPRWGGAGRAARGCWGSRSDGRSDSRSGSGSGSGSAPSGAGAG
mmetsp:Transcript_18627/g.45707  ORF Transcript_18627/g.45707 Transcript_18627/m.45707 type:complete len:237 (-) Transcript_18627:59-769(-)